MWGKSSTLSLLAIAIIVATTLDIRKENPQKYENKSTTNKLDTDFFDMYPLRCCRHLLSLVRCCPLHNS